MVFLALFQGTLKYGCMWMCLNDDDSEALHLERPLYKPSIGKWLVLGKTGLFLESGIIGKFLEDYEPKNFIKRWYKYDPNRPYHLFQYLPESNTWYYKGRIYTWLMVGKAKQGITVSYLLAWFLYFVLIGRDKPKRSWMACIVYTDGKSCFVRERREFYKRFIRVR